MSVAERVPLQDLQAQYRAIKPDIDEAIGRVLQTQQFILGPDVMELEDEIGRYCHVAEAVGCASGSDALLLALMALGVAAGDEVVCPTYSFFATAGAIARLGAAPVFADIDSASFNLDVASCRAAAERCKRLKAILPVHLFGRCADLSALESLARELDVPLVEDAAQAIGSEDAMGRRAGSVGAVGCLSFFPSKNLGAFGDAGMSTTNNPPLADAMRLLRVHGARPKYYHKVVGFNSRLDTLQAAVLRVKLRHLDQWTAARRRIAARYDCLFLEAGASTSEVPIQAAPLPVLTPHPGPARGRHIYNQYVIRVPAAHRNPLRSFLKERGIDTAVFYPLPLHLQECFRDLKYTVGSFPHAEAAARETVALPIYPEMVEDQVEFVVASVLGFMTRH